MPPRPNYFLIHTSLPPENLLNNNCLTTNIIKTPTMTHVPAQNTNNISAIRWRFFMMCQTCIISYTFEATTVCGDSPGNRRSDQSANRHNAHHHTQPSSDVLCGSHVHYGITDQWNVWTWEEPIYIYIYKFQKMNDLQRADETKHKPIENCYN